MPLFTTDKSQIKYLRAFNFMATDLIQTYLALEAQFLSEFILYSMTFNNIFLHSHIHIFV